jgi:hypothetical protein
MVKLQTPLGAANVLIEPLQKISRDGVYIARTLVRDRPRLPVHIMNVTNRNQVLSEGSIIGHREAEVWATVIDD